jgi:HEAT repeat protein
VQAIVEDLRADRGRAVRILDELSRHRSPDVRGWVAWATPQALGEGGVHVLVGLTRDRDAEVRDAAIEELVALDPGAARKLVPSLRRRLRSPEPHEPVTAMWTLAELHDRESLPQVRRIVEGENLDPWQRAAAEIVVMLLEERGDEVVRAIRDHDHERMPWLATGARILATDEARDALEECAREAPDEGCRRACTIELERLEETA